MSRTARALARRATPRSLSPMRDWDMLDVLLLLAGATVLALWFRARRPPAATGSPRRTLLPLLLAVLLAAVMAGWAYQQF